MMMQIILHAITGNLGWNKLLFNVQFKSNISNYGNLLESGILTMIEYHIHYSKIKMRSCC